MNNELETKDTLQDALRRLAFLVLGEGSEDTSDEIRVEMKFGRTTGWISLGELRAIARADLSADAQSGEEITESVGTHLTFPSCAIDHELQKKVIDGLESAISKLKDGTAKLIEFNIEMATENISRTMYQRLYASGKVTQSFAYIDKEKEAAFQAEVTTSTSATQQGS